MLLKILKHSWINDSDGHCGGVWRSNYHIVKMLTNQWGTFYETMKS